MTRNLGQNIKTFEIPEERLLRSPMVNCRRWLNSSEQKTLFKIINIVYDMNEEPVYEDEVITLYDKIIKQLSKRTAVKQQKVHVKTQIARKAFFHKPFPPSRFQPVAEALQHSHLPTLPTSELPFFKNKAER